MDPELVAYVNQLKSDMHDYLKSYKDIYAVFENMYQQMELAKRHENEREEHAISTKQELDELKVETLALKRQLEDVISTPGRYT